MGLVLYLRHLGEPLRNDIARLVDVSGVWVRNIGERHQTKRHVLQIIRRIIPRLERPPALMIKRYPIRGGIAAAIDSR